MSILFFTTDLDIKDFPYHGSNVEALCFPLIIELTYLGCNKRHLDTLLGSFDNKWIQTIISFFHCSAMKIAPHQYVYSIGALNS
uniref:Ovule protein n=1 Tax=Caenorhabditis tropicalis TaxID=1561998 RepID=A0A1I7TH40_9PELO